MKVCIYHLFLSELNVIHISKIKVHFYEDRFDLITILFYQAILSALWP